MAIVEDDIDIRSLYAIIVRRLGYPSPIQASNGTEIIELVSSGRAKPDLVLIDYRLPGMNGLDTARRLSALLPALRIAITTGDDEVESQAVREGFHFIQKPFSTDQLGRLLDKLRGPESLPE